MVLFKVRLSEQMIANYVQPKGTRDCGTNCTICTLSMLGFLDESRSTAGTDLCIAKRQVTLVQAIRAAENYINSVTGKEYKLQANTQTRDVQQTMVDIASALSYGEATLLVYGTPQATHVVVLRKSETGEMELIDPQRGTADLDKRYGFTTERAQELGIVSREQYYRVKGPYNIGRVMVEQSLKFGYANTEEELAKTFIVNTCLIDSPVEAIVPPKQPLFGPAHPLTGLGRKKTRKRSIRKRKTRRSTFSY